MLRPLTSFRFIAALMVFVWHSDVYHGVVPRYAFGYMGVSFFFLLSGFILTYNYYGKFPDLRFQNISAFYVARFAKIYPVHVLTFICAIPLQMGIELSTGHPVIHDVEKAILNISLLQTYLPHESLYFSYNGVSWSLSDEIFFYVLLPLVLYFLQSCSLFLTKSRALGLMVGIWIVEFLLLYQQQVGMDNWLLYIFPPTRIVDFLQGTLLGILFINRNTVRSSKAKYTLLECLALVALVGGILYSPNMPMSTRFSVYFMPFWCLLIYVYSFQRGYISQLLSHRLAVFMGDISFSFYMIHELVIRYILYLDGRSIHVSPSPYIELVASLCLSGVIYYLFEEPIRKKIRAKYRIRQTRQGIPSSFNSPS